VQYNELALIDFTHSSQKVKRPLLALLDVMIAVVLLRILYGVDVWCVPAHKGNEGGSQKSCLRVIGKLTKSARKAKHHRSALHYMM
jgi:hypothetical protein